MNRRATEYSSRLEKLGLNTSPLTYTCPSPSSSALAELSSRIPHGIGGSTSTEARVNQALKLWRASHAELYAREQGATLACGLLLYNRDDWVKHAGSIVAAFEGISMPPVSMEVVDRLKSFGGRCRAKRPSTKAPMVQFNANGHGAAKAGAIIASTWRSFSLTNGEVMRALFPGSAGCWRSRTADLLKQVAVVRDRIWAGTKWVLTDRAIADRVPPIQFDAVEPDELDLISEEIKAAWYPLGGYDRESAWCVAELLRLGSPDPETFCKASTFAWHPQVVRWLSSLS